MRQYFPTVVGNEALRSRIGRAIEEKCFSHATLIAAPRGCGKHTLAYAVAAALNCEERASVAPLPCGTCRSCRRIMEGNYTDVKLLGRAEGRATIGVEDIRRFREDMFLSATESDHKVYIIEDFDTATPAAQNALLKVLEEPPPDVVILLLADGTEKILTTIRSRVQLLRLERLAPEVIEDYLLRCNAQARTLAQSDRDALRAAVLRADGRLGEALSDLSGKEREATRKSRAVTDALIDACRPSVPYLTLREAVTALPGKRQELAEQLDTVLLALRDLFMMKCDPSRTPLYYMNAAAAKQAAEPFTKKRLLSLFDLFVRTAQYNRQNGNINAILSALAAELKSL